MKKSYSFIVCGIILMLGKNAYSQAWKEERRQEVKGSSQYPTVHVNHRALNNPFETESKFSVDTNVIGNWIMEVELFPGANRIVAQSGEESEERLVTFRIKPPNLRVVLTWAGQNQDYDLHVNEIYFGNAVTAGGELDQDWIDDEYPGGPAIETISYEHAGAGLYHVGVHYYSDNEEDGGSPLPTTVKIYLNEKLIATYSKTLTEPSDSFWHVASVVVHSGESAGGFKVNDDSKAIDLPLQGDIPGVMPSHSHAKTWTDPLILNVTGTSDPVYMNVGEAAQFKLYADLEIDEFTVMSFQSILGELAVENVSGGGDAMIDELGVFVAKAPGHYRITAEPDADKIDVYIFDVNLDGDYDRDANPDDHFDEDQAVSFEGPKGMVIFANTNDDAEDGTKQPDCEDNVINGENDLVDIYTLSLAKFGMDAESIPSAITFELSVLNPEGDLWGGPAAKERIRIFRSRDPAAQGVVGPDSLPDKVVFKKNPGPADMNIDLLAGDGFLELGIEGIEHGREVIIQFSGFINGEEIGSDVIRLLVAPFLVLSNTDKATKVFVANNDFGWETFFNHVNLRLNGYIDVVDYGSTFIQDRGEIGATRSAPNQADRKRCVIADFVYPNYKDLISSDTGYFHIGAGSVGGNVEASPPIVGYPYGRIIVGDSLNDFTKSFLKTQKIQTDQENNYQLIELPVQWLLTKHVDAVMTIIPDGGNFKVLVADLELAIAVLRANPEDETWGGYDSREVLLAAYDNPNNADMRNHINAQLALIREKLSTGLGINQNDIIKVPVAFEVHGEIIDGVGQIKSHLPNMINMIVVDTKSGNPRLVVPYPYFDPLYEELIDGLVNINVLIGEVDTKALHDGSDGNAHCGSNVRRELQ